MKTILTRATLIDCVDPTPKPDSTVVVEGGRITQIARGAAPTDTAGAEVFDLKIGRASCRERV